MPVLTEKHRKFFRKERAVYRDTAGRDMKIQRKLHTQSRAQTCTVRCGGEKSVYREMKLKTEQNSKFGGDGK